MTAAPAAELAPSPARFTSFLSGKDHISAQEMVDHDWSGVALDDSSDSDTLEYEDTNTPNTSHRLVPIPYTTLVSPHAIHHTGWSPCHAPHWHTYTIPMNLLSSTRSTASSSSGRSLDASSDSPTFTHSPSHYSRSHPHPSHLTSTPRSTHHSSTTPPRSTSHKAPRHRPPSRY